MSPTEAKDKTREMKQILSRMLETCSFMDLGMFIDNEDTGSSFLLGNDDMATAYPKENKKLKELWGDLQKNIPPGFNVDGNLIRHLSFNEAKDWLDIKERDIPREFVKIDEYMKKLHLIEYLESLHSEISKVAKYILNGDIEPALKAVFTSLDTNIRARVKPLNQKEATVLLIERGFKDGKLCMPNKDNNNSVKNFLQGVIGHYRNSISHNHLPTSRNSIEGSLSLFAVAHEAFRLLDLCTN